MITKKTAHILMVFVVFCWGLDIVAAKEITNFLPTICVILTKYGIGVIIVGIIAAAKEGLSLIKKEDILKLILSAVTGLILYSFFQYKALDYMSVSLITIILAFVPTVSVIIERVLYKRSANKKIYAGLIICVFGVALVVGGDIDVILDGKAFGYLLCLGALLSWNCYTFVTAAIANTYSPLKLSFNQMLCTALIALPFALYSMPPLNTFTPLLIGEMIYIGSAAGITFIISIIAIKTLGPTATSIYSNLYPITATLFAWAFLEEAVTISQVAGGAIVIAAACFIIIEKGKLDTHEAELEKTNHS